jgi:ABC-type Na+ transport system ATPase subunit NatA
LYQDLTSRKFNVFATIFGTTLEENYDAIKEIYVQIEPFKDRRAGALSGGMKQKLALCCALIHKPKFYFLMNLLQELIPFPERVLGYVKRLQQKGLRYWSPRPTWMKPLYVTGLH